MVLVTRNLRVRPLHGDAAYIGPVNLQLAAGQKLGIAGGNGAGKTLLAQALSGHSQGLALEGELEWGTKRIQWVGPRPQAQLSGCAFSVWQEVAFGPENLGLEEVEIRLRTEQAMDWSGCAHLAQRAPDSLSGGETQRVVLAAALAMRPELLILDQAFSRLTPATTQILLAQLDEYADEHHCGLILCDQQFQPLAGFVDQVLLLKQGQVVVQGPAGSLVPQMLAELNCSDAWRWFETTLAGQPDIREPQRWPRNDNELIQWFIAHQESRDA